MESINKKKFLNEKKRSKTNSNFNRLVPKLLEQSNKLTKELKNRIKLNSFFSEFESKASNQFNFFIKESRTRYRGTRSGCNLDTLIATSRRKCLKEANKIINDNFYSNNDILVEKEKMKKKTTNRMYMHFRETLSQLKNLSNNSNTISLTNINNKNILSQKNIKRRKKLFGNKKNISIMSSEKLFKEKNDIKLILNKEESLFHKTMDSYKNDLNALNTLSETQKYTFAHKNMRLNLPKLNLLTYKKYVPPPIDPDEEEMRNRVNFKKLLPYSRLGKNLGYTQNIVKNKNKKNAFITEPKFGFFTNYGDYMNNVKNTNEIVLNSANKEFSIENRINRKRKIIEDMLGVDSIPNLDSYEVIVKNIFKKRKKERDNNNKNNLFDVKKEEETFYEKTNKKIEKGFNILNNIEQKLYGAAQEEFNKIYKK